MAPHGVDAFLRAEEQADRLVTELTRLKEEIESYRTAHQALGQAAEGVSALAARSAELAVQLGRVVETLRSIGTPELLRRQEAVSSEVAAFRRAARNHFLWNIGLLVIALALLAWLALSLPRV